MKSLKERIPKAILTTSAAYKKTVISEKLFNIFLSIAK